MRTPQPPTIAHLKTRGLEGFFVTCGNAACQHSVPFTFGALKLDDDVQFPSITQGRRFICTRCGARTLNVMPDRRTHNASGIGLRRW